MTRTSDSIRHWMICWTSPVGRRREETAGQAALIAWPDTRGASDRYGYTSGACESRVHEMNRLQRQHYVLSTALGMILRDGLEPSVVHRALWPLSEYRDGLPSDVQCDASR